jgi:hypothetical protein
MADPPADGSRHGPPAGGTWIVCPRGRSVAGGRAQRHPVARVHAADRRSRPPAMCGHHGLWMPPDRPFAAACSNGTDRSQTFMRQASDCGLALRPDQQCIGERCLFDSSRSHAGDAIASAGGLLSYLPAVTKIQEEWARTVSAETRVVVPAVVTTRSGTPSNRAAGADRSRPRACRSGRRSAVRRSWSATPPGQPALAGRGHSRWEGSTPSGRGAGGSPARLRSTTHN